MQRLIFIANLIKNAKESRQTFISTTIIIYRLPVCILNVFWKAILSTFWKSHISVESRMGLRFRSYTRLKTGWWSAISTVIILLEDTKLERPKQLSDFCLSSTCCLKYQGIKSLWLDQIEVFFRYCVLRMHTDVKIA